MHVLGLDPRIDPHFIRPASPQENGRHERMHRTLKAETSRPPAADAAEQQARFDEFRRYFNEDRPHEALGQVPPAQVYVPSERPMLEDPWYDADHETRRVRTDGSIRWRGEYVFIGEPLCGELVGLSELDTGDHFVRFAGHDLGVRERALRSAAYAASRNAENGPNMKNCQQSSRFKLSGVIPVAKAAPVRRWSGAFRRRFVL